MRHLNLIRFLSFHMKNGVGCRLLFINTEWSLAHLFVIISETRQPAHAVRTGMTKLGRFVAKKEETFIITK